MGSVRIILSLEQIPLTYCYFYTLWNCRNTVNVSFAPTPAELAYAGQLFATCDPQGIGIITGDAAVPVFAGSSLPPDTLGEIWSLSDHDNNGFLTKKGVAVAVRLIAWAQKGEPITEALLSKRACLYPAEHL